MIWRWQVWGVALLAALGLMSSPSGRAQAEEPARWEALGPDGQAVNRLFTPASGALLTGTERDLLRSDDGGLSWRAIEPPVDASVVTVAPTDHQQLYAAGRGGVYRSEDGGASWPRISEQAGDWRHLEVSPADPSVLYAVAVTSPPAGYGQNHWHEFRVSHDAGASWETVRTHRERLLPGQHPCAYSVRLLLPHAVSTVRVMTIEGCTGRGMEPLPRLSADEGRTTAPFPELGQETWAAHAAVGGGGAQPARWYAALYRPGIPYTRIRHSKLVRTDDDGASWTTVYEDHGGEPSKSTARPMELVSALAYDAERPDEVYAVFERYEPDDPSFKEHRYAGATVRRSLDGGGNWSEMGSPDAPRVTALAVGVDGRYLFAATPSGVHRIALRR